MLRWFNKWSREADLEKLPPYVPLQNAEDVRESISEDSTLRAPSPEMEKPMLQYPSRLRRATKRALKCLRFFVPSILQPSSGEPRRLHPTAWLDGLRGIAALLVVFHHCSLLWFSWEIHSGWRPGQRFFLVQLPIIRLFISGPPQIAVFFVVSGYAISHKALKLTRQGRFGEVGATLSSSVFRRHTRLFMPAAIVTFFTVLITFMGWFENEGLPGVAAPTRAPPRSTSLYWQLVHYTWIEAAVTDPVGQGHAQTDVPPRIQNPYDANLWTLPIEFNSSMVVFMFLTAFARVYNPVRIAFALAVMAYFQYYRYWALFLFFSGMFICDVHFELEHRLRSAEAPESDETTVQPMWVRARQGIVSRIKRKIRYSRIIGRLLSLGLFIFSLWLLSMPEAVRGGRVAPGFRAIASLVPYKFHETLIVPSGAVLLVFIVDRATYLQILFTNSFSQYMGRISYSLYMVHGPLLWSLGAVLGRRCVYFTGGATHGMRYALGIALASFLWWPVTIYLADLTYKGIDSKSVQIARWAYEKLSRKEP